MSLELIAILAILITAAFQSAILGTVAVMVYRMSSKQTADDAALYLQGRKLEEAIREMRESLRG